MSEALAGLGRAQEGYPPEWPLVALIVKKRASWRCEHCGIYLPPGGASDEALTVHHLDANKGNLMSWNLVPLCLRDHGLVERQIGSIELAGAQLTLLDEPLFPWLPARLRDREHYPYRPEALRTTETAAPDPRAPRPGGDAAQAASERFCACGCGQRIAPDTAGGLPRRYVDRAHQQRAYRERQAAQTSLLAALVIDHDS